MNKVLPGLPFVASYSGGKDSVLAIHRAVQCGMKLQALLITYNVDRGRSWFHGIPAEVVAAIAAAVACMDGGRYTLRSVVRKREGRSAWNMAGVIASTDPF